MVAKPANDDTLWDGVCATCCALAAPGSTYCLDCCADIEEERSEPSAADLLEAQTDATTHGGD